MDEFFKLSLYFSGLGLIWGSGLRDFFRLTVADCVESSIYFSWIALFPLKGLRMEGLKQAPLNFIMNNRPPRKILALNPPGKGLCEDLISQSVREDHVPSS